VELDGDEDGDELEELEPPLGELAHPARAMMASAEPAMVRAILDFTSGLLSLERTRRFSGKVNCVLM
jgi:hypothetical protein